MKTRLIRGIMFYGFAALVSAACAEAPRDFNPAPGGAGGIGEQSSSTTSGMGGQPGAGGMGGQPGSGGMGGKPDMSGSGGNPHAASSSSGGGGVGGNGGDGGTGGQGAECIWIDITSADCSSGIMIADFCPPGRKVKQLERCDATFYTPDAAYQMYKLSGCPDVCPIAGDHVSWRKIECCL